MENKMLTRKHKFQISLLILRTFSFLQMNTIKVDSVRERAAPYREDAVVRVCVCVSDLFL